METTNLLLSIAWPVSLSTLYYPALHIVDLAIVGHSLGALSLTAATLTLLVVNLTLEDTSAINVQVSLGMRS